MLNNWIFSNIYLCAAAAWRVHRGSVPGSSSITSRRGGCVEVLGSETRGDSSVCARTAWNDARETERAAFKGMLGLGKVHRPINKWQNQVDIPRLVRPFPTPWQASGRGVAVYCPPIRSLFAVPRNNNPSTRC